MNMQSPFRFLLFVSRLFGHRSSAQRLALARFCATVVLCTTRVAAAYSNGVASQGCAGCHGGGKPPTVTLTADSTTIAPGQLVNLTLSISQTNGPVAGFFLQANSGALSIVDPGTKLISGGVTHSSPRTGSGGETTFRIGWTAPAQPGGVDFNVWANSANGDGKSSGDGEGTDFLSVAYGCTGIKFFHDFDGDAYGADSSGYTMNCSLPQYFAKVDGDCDDNDPNINPGTKEICDGKDNNCNGQIDEGFPIITYCADADGDGHGVGSAVGMACKPPRGSGLCDNDCNDNDPTIYPGAKELCDGKDNNCNGQIDEGAQITCGVGWCARDGDSCNSTACTPGAPRAEECNDFDDDCDGIKDNGTDIQLCGKPGLACRMGVCVPDADAGANTGTSGASGSSQPVNPTGGGRSTGTASGSDSGSSSTGGASSTANASSSSASASSCAVVFSRANRDFAFAGLLMGFGVGLRRVLRRRTRSVRKPVP